MKFKYIPQFVLCLCLTLSAVAFADEQDALFENTWILHSLNHKDIDLSLYPDHKPSLTFKSDNTYSAYAGCNQIIGRFALDGVIKLEFATTAAMTKMACSGPQNIEDEFVAMLQKVRYWTIKDYMLILQNEHKAPVATFTQQLMH